MPPVLNLINELTEKITKPKIESTFGRLMLNKELLSNLVNLGASFILDDFTSLGDFLEKILYNIYSYSC